MEIFQVVLVSATLPHEILEMTQKFMTDPIRILVKRYVFFYESELSFNCACGSQMKALYAQLDRLLYCLLLLFFCCCLFFLFFLFFYFFKIFCKL